ncbi:MAG: glycosyltransferase [Bacteroidales bacterium]|nr:glycosyltransferase [Bacteroidales bacterium]MCF8334724.1 glycosyltransferase [Bacteroidales bacterium]
MKNTSEKHLHIVAFAVPYPPNYGGVIDVFYKIKALHRAGIKVHLHAFTYKRHTPSEELAKYCESIHYYPRRTGWKANCAVKPYIVQSRLSGELVERLAQDDYPVLFEGLHTCGVIDHPFLKDKKKIYRESNIEHHYYYNLFQSEKNILKKPYFLIESLKLRLFQKKLKHADLMMVVSQKDTEYLQKHFPEKKVVHLPSFHPNETLNIVSGQGDFALYHGNLAVAENYHAAEYLIQKIFSHTDIPLVIAGLNPPDKLKRLAGQHQNVTLIENADDDRMFQLIREAQVHVLITFQATGLKLKLLNTLYNGRHILVNPAMVSGTLAEDICEQGRDANELRSKLTTLMKESFDESAMKKRKKLLERYYSNGTNVNRMMGLVWSK